MYYFDAGAYQGQATDAAGRETATISNAQGEAHAQRKYKNISYQPEKPDEQPPP